MIIVGNLKMNQTLEEASIYESKLTNSGIIICPSFPYLPIYKQNGYELCAQNVSEYNDGPYTGDVSASQLKSLKVKYVLIGHSERRHVYKEAQESLNNKVLKSLKQGMQVVYCIGETYEQKQNNQTFQTIENQILSLFNIIDNNDINKIIIGYEPVWAISDGINPGATPTNQEIDEVNKYITELVKEKYNQNIKILYGGSVNLNNIEQLVKLNNNAGFLIGGASKNVEDLLKIQEICKQ
ncbi:MAG: triosephosphate isomerase [Mollicutes bacterium]|jgi:triosephosphate isomerase|nr:triosephosphate isomerase [Mollicutes bacterium]